MWQEFQRESENSFIWDEQKEGFSNENDLTLFLLALKTAWKPFLDCENCYPAHFKDDNIDISVPENLFKDEHFKVYAFIKNEITINRPEINHHKS